MIMSLKSLEYNRQGLFIKSENFKLKPLTELRWDTNYICTGNRPALFWI